MQHASPLNMQRAKKNIVGVAALITKNAKNIRNRVCRGFQMAQCNYTCKRRTRSQHMHHDPLGQKPLFFCKLQHQRKQNSCQPSKIQKVQLATPPKKGPEKKQSHQESTKGIMNLLRAVASQVKTFERKRSLQGRSQHALMCSKPLRHAVIIINIRMSWPQSNLCWIPQSGCFACVVDT